MHNGRQKFLSFRSLNQPALLAFSLRLSERGSDLSPILVDGLDGLDDRKLAVASYASELAGRQANCPLEGRAYRLENAVRDALVLHGGTKVSPPKFRPLPDTAIQIFFLALLLWFEPLYETLGLPKLNGVAMDGNLCKPPRLLLVRTADVDSIGDVVILTEYIGAIFFHRTLPTT
jgi:hypothetical protein